MTNRQIDDLLSKADPLGAEGLRDPEIWRALEGLKEEIHELHTKQPTKIKHRRTLIAIAAFAMLGTATAAAAANGVFSRTGVMASGGEAGTGEVIRLDVPDAPSVILELGADIPLPPGGNFDSFIVGLPDEPTDTAEESLVGMLEFNAGCQWGGYWLEAQAAGDTDAMALAQTAIDQLPQREGLVSNWSPPDAGRIFWQRFADAARTNDPQILRDEAYTANCTYQDPADH